MGVEIVLNGTHEKISYVKLHELLLSINFSSGAVAVNNVIVHKEDFDKIMLNNNDKVDIVEVVGGG